MRKRANRKRIPRADQHEMGEIVDTCLDLVAVIFAVCLTLAVYLRS